MTAFTFFSENTKLKVLMAIGGKIGHNAFAIMGHVTEQSAMITQLILALAAFANMISVGSLGLEHNVKLK